MTHRHTVCTEYPHEPAQTGQELLTARRRVRIDTRLRLNLITGHTPGHDVLHDAAGSSHSSARPAILPIAADVAARLAAINAPPVSLSADPPAHVRTSIALRSVVPQTLRRARQRWGTLVRHHVDELIDQITATTATAEFDLVDRFTRQLPLLVLLDVIGVPPQDAQRVHDWTTDYRWYLLGGNLTPVARLHAEQCADELWHYCYRLTSTHLTPGSPHQHDDLIDRLLRYRAGDDTRLSDAEITGIVFDLLVAGTERTTGLLTQVLRHGLREPTRWARLACDPDYAPIHVEESLRHHASVDAPARATTTDATIDNTTLSARDGRLPAIATADHDPATEPVGHDADPSRVRPAHHLAFAGEPPCPGAALACLQAITAVTALARRLPELMLPGATPHGCPQMQVRSPLAPCPTAADPRCPVAHPITAVS